MVNNVRDSIARIADVVRGSFDELVITGSLIMSRVFEVRVRPEDAVAEAEMSSSMFRATAVLTDTHGLLNSLGTLGSARVRGSLVVFVYDLWDVRPFCELMGIPCLEPWDSESLLTSIKEGRDYSEALEVPYIVRLGPWLSVDEGVRGLGVGRREPTFNKNWGEPMRWGLDRLLSGPVRELPRDALTRARDNVVSVGGGDGVLISGSAWPLISGRTEAFANYTLVRSLYVNPLPRDSISVKYVVDIDDFLSSRLGVGRLMVDEVANRYRELIEGVKRELFFREPGDPLMLIEWLLSKYVRSSEVPIIILDPAHAHIVNREGVTTSYDMLPTRFEPTNYDQVIDVVTNPLPAILAVNRAGYGYGRGIAVLSPCTLTAHQDLLKEAINTGTNHLLLILVTDSRCNDALEVLNKLAIDYKVVDYDMDKPVDSLLNLMSITNMVGVVVIRIINSGARRMYGVVSDYCDNCGDCLRIGCPAISMGVNPIIDTDRCVGCGICQLVCTRGAIVRVRST